MAQIALLLGISKGSRQTVGFMRSLIARGESKDFIRSAISSVSKLRPTLSTFNTDFGIVQSATNKWLQLGTFTRSQLVNEGYQRMVTKMPRRYKTVVRLTGIDTATGEAFLTHQTIFHDDFLKRSTIEDRALRDFETYDDQLIVIEKIDLVEGYLSR